MTGKDDKNLPLAETLAGETPAQMATGETLAASADTPPPPASDRATLAPGTAINQRYVIDSVLGSGGMGTVYLARDMSLGRDVALKLHRSGTGHDRLYREAIAMAQLAHPNVVTVFEVGAVDDQLFVAMEYIRGATLRDWVAGKPWQDIVRLLLDTGEGLAAAHRAGFVHRDFKPENVLVGKDGRPRVSDFGLARANAEVSASLPGSVPTLSPSESSHLSVPTPTTGSMTVTGTILGTPAYMAPEQYAGTVVDARSDQFSFCVAAWESLYGTRPFPGATLPQLQQAIERGRIIQPKETSVPASVRRVLARGLAPQPEGRWPEMAALLAALRTAARPRTARWVTLGALVAIAVGGVVAWKLTRGTEVDCGAADSDVELSFPAALRNEAIEIARTNSGTDAANRTAEHIAAFLRTYRATAIAACHAVAHHDWSEDLATRSRACRHEQLRSAALELRSRLDDPRIAKRMVATSAELPQIADLAPCQDANALAAMPSLPPGDSDVIAEDRARLFVVRSELKRGASATANSMIDEIAGSRIGGSLHLAAPIALARAAATRQANDIDGAIKQATDAYYKARTAVDQTSEVTALRDLLSWIGTQKQDAKGVESWYRLALAEATRFERISPLRTAELRNAIVGVAITRNEYPVAVEQARLAMNDVTDATPLIHITSIREYASALAESGDGKHAIPLYQRAATELEAALGPDEVQLAELLGDEALTFSDIGQYVDAMKVVDRASAIVAKNPGYQGVDRATLELNFASVMINADQGDRAEALLRGARDVYTKSIGPTNPTIGTIDSNLALIEGDRGHHEAAAKLLRDAIAIQEKSLGPDHPDIAATLFNLAAELRETPDHQAALEAARRCVAIRAASMPNTDVYVLSLAMQAQLESLVGQHDAALHDAATALEITAPRVDFQTSAWPKLEQARALIGLGRDPATARRLLGEARAVYVANKMSKRVAEIDALLAKL